MNTQVSRLSTLAVFDLSFNRFNSDGLKQIGKTNRTECMYLRHNIIIGVEGSVGRQTLQCTIPRSSGRLNL